MKKDSELGRPQVMAPPAPPSGAEHLQVCVRQVYIKLWFDKSIAILTEESFHAPGLQN